MKEKKLVTFMLTTKTIKKLKVLAEESQISMTAYVSQLIMKQKVKKGEL